MPDEFDILAPKVLAGEASEREQTRLRKLLAGNTQLTGEFAQLEATWNTLRDIGPTAQAMDAHSRPIPARRLRRLEEAVRKKFGDQSRSSPNHIASAPVHTVSLPSNKSQDAELGDAPEPETRVPAPFLFWGWLAQATTMRTAAWVAAAALVMLCGGAWVWLRHDKEVSAKASDLPDVAYMICSQGTSEVRRLGKPITLGPATLLRSLDEIRLPPGTAAQFVLSSGIIELRGPQRLVASDLVSKTNTNRSIPDQAPGARPPSDHQALDSLQAALFPKTARVSSPGLLLVTWATQSIPLFSPLRTTAHLTPLILWKSEPGKTYDLTIIDLFDPNRPALWLAGVVPPVKFSEVEAWKGRMLASNGLYRLTLQETGKPFSACQYTFETVKGTERSSPSVPQEKLLNCFRLLYSHPDRLGDALAELMTLPAEFANSELALRLKLFAFAQAGYKDDYDAVSGQLQRLHAASRPEP